RGDAQDARLGQVSATLDRAAAHVRGLNGVFRGDYYQRQQVPTSTEYWSRYNVTLHHQFSSTEDSLRQLEFRNQQYPGYIDLLPGLDVPSRPDMAAPRILSFTEARR